LGNRDIDPRDDQPDEYENSKRALSGALEDREKSLRHDEITSELATAATPHRPLHGEFLALLGAGEKINRKITN